MVTVKEVHTGDIHWLNPAHIVRLDVSPEGTRVHMTDGRRLLVENKAKDIAHEIRQGEES